MSIVVSDADVREQALDPGQSFIVQAPAGSGKTELLTRRILTLLARVEQPEEILAITFTRKAAQEMRQRVVETLREAQLQVPVDDDYKQQGRELANAVLAHSNELGWNLLEQPSRLSMQTIDSLCSVLTRQLPVTSSFGAPLQIQEDARPLYLEAAKNTIESNLPEANDAHQALCILLGHLDNNVERLQRLLADMLANRDQWLRHYADATSRSQLESDLSDLVSARFELFAESLPENATAILQTLVPFAQSNLRGLGLDNGLLQLASPETLERPGYDNARQWQHVANLLLTKASSATFRKSPTRKEGFPVSAADARTLGVSVAELKASKERMVELLTSFSESTELLERFTDIRDLPVEGYSEQQWVIMCSLLELLKDCVLELQLVFAETGSVDFTETALRAAGALGDEDDPTDLALAMDYRLSHILVDEFQDTSISQDALFSKLVAGWQPGDGRTFFAVGDPMQSIYRFRDAEVSLFLRACSEGLGGVPLTPLQLTVNFRSEPGIVQWCNDTFSAVFPEKNDITSGAITYAPSTAARSAGDAKFSELQEPRFYPFVDTDRVAQADWLAEIVEGVLDQGADNNESVAILVRSKSILSEIFVALQQRNIPYQAVDIETLGDRLVVKDILSLCRALQHPHDRIHWLAVLRAPWTGLCLSDLHALVDGEPGKPIWALLNNEACLAKLSEDGRRRAAHLCELLVPAIKHRAREPLVAWIESLWLRLGGPAAATGESDLLAADACFKELTAIEDSGRLWDSAYLEQRMQQLFAPASQGDDVRVQLMTIHKSKGLEFDTVILPALERQARSDGSRLLNWFEYFDDGERAKLLLAPIPETNVSSVAAAPIVRLVKDLQNQKSGNELLRLLYVAATRAKKQLHLFGAATRGAGGDLQLPARSSLLSPLWPLYETRFAQEAATPVTETETAAEVVIPGLTRLTSDWHGPDLSPLWSMAVTPESEPPSTISAEPIKFDWASANARHLGSVVHRQLQRIADEGIERWPAQRVMSLSDFYASLLNSAGVSADQRDKLAKQVSIALGNVLEDERGRWLLDGNNQDTCSEFRLTGVLDGSLVNGIIDRTFVDEHNVRWIVDFKTGAHKSSKADEFMDNELTRYKPQLERYAAMMQAWDNRKIMLGLYFPLLAGWREWSPE